MKLLLWIAMALLLIGCGVAPPQQTEETRDVQQPQEADVATPWVQFGTVEWIVNARIPSTSGEAVTEEAMNLSIRLDLGEDIHVVQAVSQAGRFSVGDRVRVLKIGGFTRVTYWPYGRGESGVEQVPEN